MGKTVVFRVDGGNIYSVGMGHVYRCVRLARLLLQKDIDSVFVMKNYPEGVAVVRSCDLSIELMDASLPAKAEAERVASLAVLVKAVLFVDLRSSKKAVVDHAEKQHIRTVVYEDVCTEHIEPTLLINPSSTAFKEERYASRKTRYLFGPDYFVLDPAIEKYRRESFSPEINRIFLCFG